METQSIEWPGIAGIPDPDEYDRRDAVLGYLSNGLWWSGAEVAEEGDEFPKAALSLDHGDVLAIEQSLDARGLGIADLGGHWLIHSLAVCPSCWEAKPITEPCSSCAAMAAEIDPEAIDTLEMCVICLRSVAGPPFPFCCSGRARLVKKIEGSGPFKACPGCRGQGCETCDGTGVML